MQREFRRIFDTIPEQFDRCRPRYCSELYVDFTKTEYPDRREFTADEYAAYAGTHCDHIEKAGIA
ncbi:MAG: hypothetical protein ACI4MF_05035 [Candidatus Faecivicinus sp.]